MIRRLFWRLPAIAVVFILLFYAAVPKVQAESSKQSALQLTAEEESYISSHKSLKIGFVQDRIPVSFSDENGELAGISRYIFDHVSELCGIKFEYVPLPTNDVTYDYLLNGGFDLVSSVEYNKENQKAKGILISNPYLSSRKVVVARDGLEFRYDANLSIAVSTGSQTLKKVLSKSYPNFKLVDYPSITACFDAIKSGKADLMIQNQYVVEHWISKPIYEKLKVIPVLGLDDQLCFSAVVAFGENSEVSQKDGKVLINILNKAIASMTEDEIGSFTIQGIMENQYSFTLSDFLYRYRYAVITLAILILVILILAVLFVRQHIRLAENKADAKIKSQFLSTMSHEIRTPMNGLIGLNYLMSQKLEDKEQLRDYLRQSTVTANYLLSLINDMLDMSRLQAQNLELELRPVDLELLLNTVSSIAQNSMADKKLIYNVNSKLSWPCILGDEVRIQQVLLNLLDNAKKFTPKGGRVDLSLNQEMTDSGKVLTTATVSDTGRGMSEEFQKHIFDTFAQELDTVSKGNQGTGLGLPISRRLAMLMGGDLTFVSRRWEGSSFTFTFIAEPAELPENEYGSAPSEDLKHQNTKILVAEDNELNGEIILELLQSVGFEAELAENGKIALQMFIDSEPDTYDIILMDLLMPEMDGFETAKAIRDLDRPDAKTVRIFACTANSFSENRDKALASGMDDFIEKPVDVKELLKKINE